MREYNGTFIFSFSIINSNNFNMGREIMRIKIIKVPMGNMLDTKTTESALKQFRAELSFNNHQPINNTIN